MPACPLCAPGTCHFQRLAPYMRKVPAIAYVARCYCPEKRVTISLLPDFYASRMPGTLDDLERAAAVAEAAPSVEKAAETLRPADALDAITLAAAIAWTRRRLALVKALLVTVAGLFPDVFVGAERSLRAFRERLRTARALVALRGIAAEYLHALPRPLGLNPLSALPRLRRHGRRQSMGPDPPAGAR